MRRVFACWYHFNGYDLCFRDWHRPSAAQLTRDMERAREREGQEGKAGKARLVAESEALGGKHTEVGGDMRQTGVGSFLKRCGMS